MTAIDKLLQTLANIQDLSDNKEVKLLCKTLTVYFKATSKSNKKPIGFKTTKED